MASDASEGNHFMELPRNLRKLVEAVGFPEITDMDDDEARIYDLVRHGRCMTCERRLGKHANFIITKIGIVGGYCSGVCHADMAVLGYLQEQHQDLSQRIDFRKSNQDRPQDLNVTEAPDTLGEDPAFVEDEGEA